MVLTFRRVRFSLRGQQHSRSFYTHPSTPLLLSLCSWERGERGKMRVKERKATGRGVMEDRKSIHDMKKENIEQVRKSKDGEWNKNGWPRCMALDRQNNVHKSPAFNSQFLIPLYSHKRAEFHWLERQMWTCVYFSTYSIHWSVCVFVCRQVQQSVHMMSNDILSNFHFSWWCNTVLSDHVLAGIRVTQLVYIFFLSKVVFSLYLFTCWQIGAIKSVLN